MGLDGQCDSQSGIEPTIDAEHSADAILADNLAKRLRESCQLLRRLTSNEVDVLRRIGVLHRSEYPGHAPGDPQAYDLENVGEYSKSVFHDDRPPAWKNRECGWPETLDRIQSDTVSAWKAVHAALVIACRLPESIAQVANDPTRQHIGLRLSAALRKTETDLGEIVDWPSISPVVDGEEDLDEITWWSILRAYVLRLHERFELAAESGNLNTTRGTHDEFRNVFGLPFLDDHDTLKEFIEPIGDAATRLTLVTSTNSALPQRVAGCNSGDDSGKDANDTSDADDAGSSVAADASGEESSESDILRKLLGVLTDNVSEQRIRDAVWALSSDKSAWDRLDDFDAAFPIPPNVSAEKISGLLGCSKTHVVNSPWWKKNRKGKQSVKQHEREIRHKKRAKESN